MCRKLITLSKHWLANVSFSFPLCYCSVTKSCLTLCDPMGFSIPGSPSPSLSPEVCSNSRPLNWWCHPTISSPVIPLSSCLQSFPTSESFPVSHLFTSGGQNNEASALASVLPVDIQGWFPLWLTSLIFFQPKGFSRVFSSTTVWKHQFFGIQPSLWFVKLLLPTVTADMKLKDHYFSVKVLQTITWFFHGSFSLC